MTVQEQINAARMKLSMAQQKLQRLNEDIDTHFSPRRKDGDTGEEITLETHKLMCLALGSVIDAQKVMTEAVLDIGGTLSGSRTIYLK